MALLIISCIGCLVIGVNIGLIIGQNVKVAPRDEKK